MKSMVVDNMELSVKEVQQVIAGIDGMEKCAGFTSSQEALGYVLENPVDVVFLDIEMPELNGLQMAKLLKERCPKTDIIFITNHSKYALEAHKLYVSGFLLKPVNRQQIIEALENLRNGDFKQKKRLRVQCFGNFEVFVDNQPLKLERTKSKELLAYLIDRKGAACTMGEVAAILWENRPDSSSQRSYLRTLIADLKKNLQKNGFEHVIIKERNSIAVNCEELDCDYYNFLQADPFSVNAYCGEYMAQYSWSEMTIGKLRIEDI